MVFTFFFVVWVFLTVVFLYCSSNLLLSLIVLELVTFFSLIFFGFASYSLFFSDYFLLSFFSIFVVEGVVGLSGLIIMVFFTGTDYLSSSTLLKI